MTLKSRIHAACISKVGDRIRSLQAELQDLKTQLGSDSKSSAGDKHETGRAMVHIEQEQISRQLFEANAQLATLHAVKTSHGDGEIKNGSLIETTAAYYYLCIGLGKLTVDGADVFVVSAQSPLGKALLGKRAGGSIQQGNNLIAILSVS